jgi:glycosyltransferase involved in cell wall biosynthesis
VHDAREGGLMERKADVIVWDGESAVFDLDRGREGRSDIVLLASDSELGPGWLDELADVAWAGERTACVAPLCPTVDGPAAAGRDNLVDSSDLDRAAIEAACAGLPRATVTAFLGGGCFYLRRDKIDAVGPLDTRVGSALGALDDWLIRARDLGFVTLRANHVFVGRTAETENSGLTGTEFPGVAGGAGGAAVSERASAWPSGRPASAKPSVPVVGARVTLASTLSVLWCRRLASSPHAGRRDARTTMGRSNQASRSSRRTLESRLPAHAVHYTASSKLRVALDLRALPREEVGTRTYAVSLARALAGLTEVELTLLVRDPAQVRGLPGRVVRARHWRDDVEVIHRPAQILDPRDLTLLYRSSAHLVLTYQDLIGYRTPMAAPSDAWYERFRGTSNLTVPTVQRLIAYSENTANEIAREFAVPRDEIAVVPLGVDARFFAQRVPADGEIHPKQSLPSRYFFSLATDFPHKNLANLLDAYAIFRSRWQDGAAAELLLAGYTSSARAGTYANPAALATAGVRFLGPVSSDQLRALYQNALAFVFPSLYEGFGLPPLEAMAAGTPVIAMPVSAVPEVVGDCAVFPDGLSADCIAAAMQRVALDDRLREDLRSRGLQHVEQFRWENTARATLDVYRSAVFHPFDRSLRSRRHLTRAILSWADPRAAGEPGAFGPIGIRDAWRALDLAVQARLRREIGRLRLAVNFVAFRSAKGAAFAERGLAIGGHRGPPRWVKEAEF